MTIEEAIQILDPETRREALREIPVMERIEADQEACRIAVAALRAQQAHDNAPLTLEELREMDGEPVWVRVAAGLWAIVNLESGEVVFSDYAGTSIEALIGQIYRRKPEEGGVT